LEKGSGTEVDEPMKNSKATFSHRVPVTSKSNRKKRPNVNGKMKRNLEANRVTQAIHYLLAEGAVSPESDRKDVKVTGDPCTFYLMDIKKGRVYCTRPF